MRDEFNIEIDQLINRQFKAKLMNNTKWREVFACLAHHQISFYLSWIENPDAPQKSFHQVSLSGIEERGYGDFGSGPFLYREIYSLAIPKIIRRPKKIRGEIYGYREIKQDSEGLLESLRQLGQLPLYETNETIEINGYI